MKIVSLLCRGESLKYIDNISKADICILVNAFHHELENANVHKYVSNCEIVTHVLSPGAYFPRAGASNIYKNYNFDKFRSSWIDLMDSIHEKYGSWDNRKHYKSWELKKIS